jgi:hypothetical protein
MQGAHFPRFVAEGSWCSYRAGQTLLQVLNRMDDQEVNDFVDGGCLAEYMKEHMASDPDRSKRDGGFAAW